MKLVIDSNALRSEQLRTYLAARKSNRAVLIDYGSVEAYKCNPLVTVQRSMEILGTYPTQVLVLHSTGKIARQDSRAPQYVRRMIWDLYTATFPLHAASIPYIGAGEPGMVAGALALHGKAQELMEQMSPDAMREFHSATGEIFNTEQISELRKGKRTYATQFQMLEMAGRMAAHQLDDDTVFGTHSLTQVVNNFAVRHVLARIILSQHWVLDGRPMLSNTRLQNDQVDAVFATYGTYFNGLMTNDQRAVRLHKELRETIAAFASLAPGLILPKLRY